MERVLQRPERGISIHALREESDARPSTQIKEDRIFQSTPSARRATKASAGEVDAIAISIHALREESDAPDLIDLLEMVNFNPRPPRGERLTD